MTYWHQSCLHVLSNQYKATEIEPLKIMLKVAVIILSVIVKCKWRLLHYFATKNQTAYFELK